MRIGELASKSDVSVRILRHYETQGLINSQRLPNGYRDYHSDAVERVRWIRDLLACGFSTREIRGFLPCLENGNSDPQQCIVKNMAKMHQLDDMIESLTERRQRLTERVTMLNGSAPHVFDTCQVDDYSKVARESFDPVHKAQRRQEVFPQDCQRAYEL